MGTDGDLVDAFRFLLSWYEEKRLDCVKMRYWTRRETTVLLSMFFINLLMGFLLWLIR